MGLYFEDFEVGAVYTTATRSIDREDIRHFADLTGDDNPLHTDPEFMRSSPFGDVIAHGLLVEAMAIGLIAELGIMEGTTIALAQADCRFRSPVLAGDQVRAVVEISGARSSDRKPDRGVIHRKISVRNQRDEEVLDMTTVSIMRRRPLAGTSEA